MILTSPAPHEIIYLDPPWHRTPCGTARTPYKTMAWAELLAFDLGAWLARDAMVFCWMTGPTQLRESAVLLRWCERFKLHEAGTAYLWLKTKQPRPERAEKLRSIILDWSSAEAERRKALAELEAMGGLDGATPIRASGPRPRAVKQVHTDRVIVLSTRKRGRVFPLLTEAQEQLVYWPKPERDAELRRLDAIQLTEAEIATRMGMSKNSVACRRRMLALGRRVAWLGEDDARLRQLVADKVPNATIAAEMARTLAAVRARRRHLELGVEQLVRWTDSEDALARSELSPDEIAASTGRSKRSVSNRRMQIGATKRPCRRWTDADDARVLAGGALEDIARELGRTVGAVGHRARLLAAATREMASMNSAGALEGL